MRSDQFNFLPALPKSQVWRDFRRIERSTISEEKPPRGPTLALKLSLSVFGHPPREGLIPMKFFSEEDIQVYMGLPNHQLNRLMLFTGQTTSRKIVEVVYPRYRETGLPFNDRFAPAESLPLTLKLWLEPVSIIIRRIIQDGWSPHPLYVLNFEADGNGPWIVRAEHLCGQVADGTHRILAYAMLGSEFPNVSVRVRVLGIRPWALAFMNCLTIFARLCMDPVHTPGFLKKRFSGSARFIPAKRPPG